MSVLTNFEKPLSLLCSFFPVAFIHGKPFYQSPGKLLISLSQSVTDELKTALDDKFRNQPGMAAFYQITGRLFHQFHALAFGAGHSKNLRMLRLGNSQVEVPAELLYISVVVGMDHPGLRHIGDAAAV